MKNIFIVKILLPVALLIIIFGFVVYIKQHKQSIKEPKIVVKNGIITLDLDGCQTWAECHGVLNAGLEEIDVNPDITEFKYKYVSFVPGSSIYQALKKNIKNNNAKAEGMTLLMLCELHQYLQNVEQMEMCFSEGIKFAKANKLYKELAAMLCRLGFAYHAAGIFDKAAKSYKDSIDCIRKNNLPTNFVQDPLRELGQLYYDQGKFVEAEKYYKEYVEYAKNNNLKELLSIALFNLGTLYIHTKEFFKAEKCYKDCLANNIANTGNKLAIRVLLYLGDAYHQQNKIAQAKKTYQECIDYANKYKFTFLAEYEDALYALKQL